MKLFGSEQGKDPRAQQWNLEDFQEYFKNERGNLGNSKKFQEVIRAFDQFAGLRGQPVNQETAIKMVKANENLKKACAAYVESRRGARTGSGKERLAVVDCLSMFREDLNLDQARDMKVVRSLEGKTWEQAGKFQVAQVVLEGGDRQVVGDAMSQRLMVEHGGKKGFFTEQMEIESLDTCINKAMEAVEKSEDSVLRAAVEAARNTVTKELETIIMTEEKPITGELEMAEYMDRLEEGSPARESVKTALTARDARKLAGDILEQYQGLLKEAGPDITRGQKGELMDKAMESAFSKAPKGRAQQYGETLRGCKEAFMDISPVEMVHSSSVQMYRTIKLGFLMGKAQMDPSTQAGREQRQAIDRALEDRNFMETWQAAANQANASEKSRSVGTIAVDRGNEVSSRNVASSRIAELLGIGGIIAHSEKMVVKSGDKVITGCFMEFAQGMDISAKGERKKRVLDTVDTGIRTPGFNKDMATMEVFDYLCAQNDRHERNMFYKLGEPDAQGKRAIIGLQGIDGDLSFGDSEELKSRYQGGLSDMTFIPDDLAKKINALDEDTLRYAIGDLIPENQIQAMMKRVETFKEHMNKNMVTLSGKEWELKPLEGQLDPRGKAYMKGLANLDYALRSKNTFGKNHKNRVAQDGFKAFRNRREEEPETAINFKETMAQKKKDGPKPPRQPGAVLGKKSEEAVERAKLLREEYRRKMEAQKGKQTSAKQGPAKEGDGPERKALGAGIRR